MEVHARICPPVPLSRPCSYAHPSSWSIVSRREGDIGHPATHDRHPDMHASQLVKQAKCIVVVRSVEDFQVNQDEGARRTEQ